MALWGKSDSLYSVGTIAVNYGNKTITGTGTSFTAAGISTGDVIVIGAGGTFGSAVISAITSDTSISIATTQYLSGAAISGIGYSITERPIYTLEDINYATIIGAGNSSSTNVVYGVDVNEAGAATTTKYAVAHAGWVGVHTYVDMHGNLRVKSETLVAMSEITGGTLPTYIAAGDAADDSVYVDAVISILTQPQSVGVGTTATATFSVSASITPSYAPLSYQWQQDPNTGTFANLAGQTSTSVSIANTDASKNNYKYRVVLTSGNVSSTSGIATMTVS
jgi:hypothetical protein